MHKDKKLILTILLAFTLLLMNIYKEYYISNYAYTTTYYEITNNQISSLRIIQLTDLHNSEFGNNNIDLVNSIKNENPDLIFITGDLINSNNQDTSIATKLITQLSSICPVYISYGNHEIEYEENYHIDIQSIYEDAGGIVLEKEYVDITINNQTIRIGGIYSYCIPGIYYSKSTSNEDILFLEDFIDTDTYTILLCHMPYCWLKANGLEEWNIDCVFAGHVHGGQIILPIVGGLYAPDFGFFTGKLYGLYYSEDNSKVLVLSRGLGSNELIPRINNVPEIVVADFIEG